MLYYYPTMGTTQLSFLSPVVPYATLKMTLEDFTLDQALRVCRRTIQEEHHHPFHLQKQFSRQNYLIESWSQMSISKRNISRVYFIYFCEKHHCNIAWNCWIKPFFNFYLAECPKAALGCRHYEKGLVHLVPDCGARGCVFNSLLCIPEKPDCVALDKQHSPRIPLRRREQ